MSEQPLLEITDLRVTFDLEGRRLTAVDGAQFSVARNETAVLAGESGSGKTITALAISRLLPPNAAISSGSIRFNGHDILRMSQEELTGMRGKEIAYIFQEPVSFLNPVFTIGDQIAETIVLHQRVAPQQARRQAAQLLEQVRIPDPQRVLASYPHQLSGGMNQRAFIAMSLACQPRLLVADEPTTSLDVTIEREILDLLMELKKSLGFSLLFITHNLAIARKISDRVIIMFQGKVVDQGATDTVFRCPRHHHTRELIQAYEKIGKL
ncbi:MAG TPA: ABC transporter ATP-binding protein [Candidatus Omnitrophota bacterium]|nr:ABC transporter ATP-binding protein [Candidatus Omnitrophota bacterium]HRZ15677.1 ABC transporter ATP-binding protein [Candidatus Omnitrophota bacterium]